MNKASIFLIVEPSPFLRPILSGWLEDEFSDSRILVAMNGEEALELAASEKPAYILVAISLPDRMDFELAHRLRQAVPDAKIVATSWFAARWFMSEIRRTRMDGFILKHELRDNLLSLWGISKE